MRPLPVLLLCLCSAVAGALVAGLLLNRRFEQLWANNYAVDVADQANVAARIHSGKADELADQIVAALPGYAKALVEHFPQAKGRDGALWLVYDAYVAADVDPPPDVQAILDELPDRAGCPLPGR